MMNDPFLSEMSIIELANRVALTIPPHQVELTECKFRYRSNYRKSFNVSIRF